MFLYHQIIAIGKLLISSFQKELYHLHQSNNMYHRFNKKSHVILRGFSCFCLNAKFLFLRKWNNTMFCASTLAFVQGFSSRYPMIIAIFFKFQTPAFVQGFSSGCGFYSCRNHNVSDPCLCAGV